MVVCKIELWRGGDPDDVVDLGNITIINDGTGTIELGNYDIYLSHAGDFREKEGYWKTGKCSYRRTLSPYHLILNALKACGIK
jgi:hypothetical protein